MNEWTSDTDHLALHYRLNSELIVAVNWFNHNGLMANPGKFHSLILASTDHDFSFEVDNVNIQKQDDIDLLAVNIDRTLKFDKHVSLICDKVNKQL